MSHSRSLPPPASVLAASPGRLPSPGLEFLQSDARLAEFLAHTVPWLERFVPDWMKDCAWDAAVEAVLSARACPERFTNLNDVRFYAKTVLVHRAVAVRRRSTRESAGDAAEEAASPDGFAANDAARDVWTALSMVPEPFREAVVARHLIGMTVAELADANGIAIQTAYNQTSIGLSKLRALFIEGVLS